jgi:hypothetical protein
VFKESTTPLSLLPGGYRLIQFGGKKHYKGKEKKEEVVKEKERQRKEKWGYRREKSKLNKKG